MNPIAATDTEQPGDWKRNGYVWLLLSGPIAVIIAGFITAYIAWNGADPVLIEKLQRPEIQSGKSPENGPMLPAQQGRNHAATPPEHIPVPKPATP